VKIPDQLKLGREAFRARRWSAATKELGAADERGRPDASDLELLATALFMVGREDEHLIVLERAHQCHLEAGSLRAAAACAFWLGMQLFLGGELSRGGRCPTTTDPRRGRRYDHEGCPTPASSGHHRPRPPAAQVPRSLAGLLTSGRRLARAPREANHIVPCATTQGLASFIERGRGKHVESVDELPLSRPSSHERPTPSAAAEPEREARHPGHGARGAARTSWMVKGADAVAVCLGWSECGVVFLVRGRVGRYQ
jgi:hypothetical protein